MVRAQNIYAKRRLRLGCRWFSAMIEQKTEFVSFVGTVYISPSQSIGPQKYGVFSVQIHCISLSTEDRNQSRFSPNENLLAMGLTNPGLPLTTRLRSAAIRVVNLSIFKYRAG